LILWQDRAFRKARLAGAHFARGKRPEIDVNSSPRNHNVLVCNDTCLRRSICSHDFSDI
jgi:hypothetical protein